MNTDKNIENKNNNDSWFINDKKNSESKVEKKPKISLKSNKLNLIFQIQSFLIKRKYVCIIFVFILVFALSLGLGLRFGVKPSTKANSVPHTSTKYSINDSSYASYFTEEVKGNGNSGQNLEYYRYIMSEWKSSDFKLSNNSNYSLSINKKTIVPSIVGNNTLGFSENIIFNFTASINTKPNPSIITPNADNPYTIFGVYSSAKNVSFTNVFFNVFYGFQIFVVGFGKNNIFSSFGLILSTNVKPTSGSEKVKWELNYQVTPISGYIKKI